MSKETKETKGYEHEVGAAQSFWTLADYVSGKGKRRKAGTTTSLLGIIATALSFLFSGKLGLVMFLGGIVAILTGLCLRFIPDRKAEEEEEEEVKAVETKAIESSPEEQAAAEFTGQKVDADSVLQSHAAQLGISKDKWAQISSQVKEKRANKPNVLLYNAVIKSAEMAELVQVS